MSEQSKGKLLQITFKVRPAVEHPTYYEWQAGFLNIWLFCGPSESADEAIQRAAEILERLPYETVGTKVSIRECPAETTDNPTLAQKEKEARQSGLMVYISGIVTGGDDEDFETWDFP